MTNIQRTKFERKSYFYFRGITLPAQTFLGLSCVPPHERLLNGPVTSVRWQLANHSFSSYPSYPIFLSLSTREICSAKCSTFSLTYELHQQLQTYILYRQLIRSTLRTGLAWTKSNKWDIQQAKQSTDSHVNSYILIMWSQKGQKEQQNLFIELYKHRLNQIDGRNVCVFFFLSSVDLATLN